MSIKVPYLSKRSLVPLKLFGKIEKSIFDPSSGGIGTRLNTAKTRFVIITRTEIYRKLEENTRPNLIKIPKNKAIKRLEAGPARATNASPHLWFFRLYGLNGTGLAQPIIKPLDKYVIVGNTTEPKRSKCLKGFKVNLPWYFAVLSPSL